MVLLDLEDAVAPTEKEAARATVAEAVGTGDWGDAIVAVRVNDWSTRWTTFDILEVVAGAGPRLDEIVLRAPTASRWSTVPTCGFGTSTGCGTTASGPAPSASTASGPSTPTSCRSSTRPSRPRRSSRPRLRRPRRPRCGRRRRGAGRSAPWRRDGRRGLPQDGGQDGRPGRASRARAHIAGLGATRISLRMRESRNADLRSLRAACAQRLPAGRPSTSGCHSSDASGSQPWTHLMTRVLAATSATGTKYDSSLSSTNPDRRWS
jgi:HpcH/HpaI aldolase/citrate lyase family